MNPGLLSKRITLYKLTDSVNNLNQDIQTLEKIKTIWAAILPVKGTEYYEASRTEDKVDHKIVTRYHDWIKPDMIVKYGNREFEIVSIVNPKSSNKELNIMVTEIII